MVRQACAVLGMFFLAHLAAAQFTQQGSKLVGDDAAGAAIQGASVAVSADGTTAIIGGDNDNSGVGAAWVYTRNGGVWSQQGSKLVGIDAVGLAQQGSSVAISADATTAIVGGPYDNSRTGAAWVYTRNGGVWSQQGSKLVGTGAIGAAAQGASVAVSADGNTAIVGGSEDNGGAGAAWVFTRNGGVWSQQGSKLVGTGAVGPWGAQGSSVAISADGNAAIVGGPLDTFLGPEACAGAVWAFSRSNDVWAQQGGKLVAQSPYELGISVAISADGNTSIVGGFAGAAVVYTRSGGVWAQQGSTLVGSGNSTFAWAGDSVAISGDGNTAIIGGFSDNSGVGAAWMFTRTGGVWSQQGSKLVGTGAIGPAQQGASVAISADGSTAIVGGPGDNSSSGAAWVFFNDCPAPLVTEQPQSQSIQSGQTATLSVTATGAESFQWYEGDAGDTSTPVGANASTFTTPPLESTTSYWVWVFNACGTADSATATISVERRVRRHLQRAP